MKGLEGKPCEEWLQSLGWFGLEERRLRRNLTVVCSFLTGVGSGAGTDLFSVVTVTGAEGWPDVVSGEV